MKLYTMLIVVVAVVDLCILLSAMANRKKAKGHLSALWVSGMLVVMAGVGGVAYAAYAYLASLYVADSFIKVVSVTTAYRIGLGAIVVLILGIALCCVRRLRDAERDK